MAAAQAFTGFPGQVSTRCAVHQDREAIGACCSCGLYVCPECKVSVSGQVFCAACLDARLRTGSWPQQTRLVAAFPSGSGAGTPAPPEIRGWNWGGFLLTWIWGIGNNVWISLLALLSFLPYLGGIAGLAMAIVLGIRGNEWAWQHKHWDSVEHFKKVQRSWMWWGVGVLIANLLLIVALGVLLVSLFMIAQTLGLLGNLKDMLPWLQRLLGT